MIKNRDFVTALDVRRMLADRGALVTRQTIYALARRGELASIRIGRKIFIRPESVERLLEDEPARAASTIRGAAK